MAQYQITVDQELLHRLFLGNNKDAGVSALLESVLNQVLQAQATEQLQAEPYERRKEGIPQRHTPAYTNHPGGNHSLTCSAFS